MAGKLKHSTTQTAVQSTLHPEQKNDEVEDNMNVDLSNQSEPPTIIIVDDIPSPETSNPAVPNEEMPIANPLETRTFSPEKEKVSPFEFHGPAVRPKRTAKNPMNNSVYIDTDLYESGESNLYDRDSDPDFHEKESSDTDEDENEDEEDEEVNEEILDEGSDSNKDDPIPKTKRVLRSLASKQVSLAASQSETSSESSNRDLVHCIKNLSNYANEYNTVVEEGHIFRDDTYKWMCRLTPSFFATITPEKLAREIIEADKRMRDHRNTTIPLHPRGNIGPERNIVTFCWSIGLGLLWNHLVLMHYQQSNFDSAKAEAEAHKVLAASLLREGRGVPKMENLMEYKTLLEIIEGGPDVAWIQFSGLHPRTYFSMAIHDRKRFLDACKLVSVKKRPNFLVLFNGNKSMMRTSSDEHVELASSPESSTAEKTLSMHEQHEREDLEAAQELSRILESDPVTRIESISQSPECVPENTYVENANETEPLEYDDDYIQPALHEPEPVIVIEDPAPVEQPVVTEDLVAEEPVPMEQPMAAEELVEEESIQIEQPVVSEATVEEDPVTEIPDDVMDVQFEAVLEPVDDAEFVAVSMLESIAGTVYETPDHPFRTIVVPEAQQCVTQEQSVHENHLSKSLRTDESLDSCDETEQVVDHDAPDYHEAQRFVEDTNDTNITSKASGQSPTQLDQLPHLDRRRRGKQRRTKKSSIIDNSSVLSDIRRSNRNPKPRHMDETIIHRAKSKRSRISSKFTFDDILDTMPPKSVSAKPKFHPKKRKVALEIPSKSDQSTDETPVTTIVFHSMDKEIMNHRIESINNSITFLRSMRQEYIVGKREGPREKIDEITIEIAQYEKEYDKIIAMMVH